MKNTKVVTINNIVDYKSKKMIIDFYGEHYKDALIRLYSKWKNSHDSKRI